MGPYLKLLLQGNFVFASARVLELIGYFLACGSYSYMLSINPALSLPVPQVFWDSDFSWMT